MTSDPDSPKIGQSAPAGTPLPPPAAAPGDPSHTAMGGVTVGRVVDVTVVTANPSEVEVHLADGRLGVIARSEFEGPVAVGDTISAALLARADPKRRLVLSYSWARKLRAWEKIEQARESSTPVKGKVTKSVKGGYVVDIGVRGFLPTSLVSEAPLPKGETLVGTEIEALVADADRDADRVVLSVRDFERRERRSREREAFRNLKPGSPAKGVVVSIEEFGVLVDLGDVTGLVHRSEITWGRLESIESIVSVGDHVDVVILDVIKSKRRIKLSLRQVEPDPLDSVEVGAIECATAVRVVDYGVFVRIDSNGADGLVHMTELSDVPGYRPGELVTPGEQLMVKVLGVDHRRRRLALSVRQALLID